MSNSELIMKLIKTLPKIDCIDDEGNNICHHLANNKNNTNTIFNNVLKNNDFKPNWKGLLNKRNDDGNTPLHVAIKNKNTKLAEQFIKLGANNKIPDLTGSYVQFDTKQKGGGSNKTIKITGKRVL